MGNPWETGKPVVLSLEGTSIQEKPSYVERAIDAGVWFSRLSKVKVVNSYTTPEPGGPNRIPWCCRWSCGRDHSCVAGMATWPQLPCDSKTLCRVCLSQLC